MVHKQHTNSQGNFNKDKSQLKPETSTKNAVLPEVVAQTLVLCADEDGRNNVTRTVGAVSHAW